MTPHRQPGPAKTAFAFQQSADGGNRYQLYIYDDITKYGALNWETWEYEDADTSANKIREHLQSVPEGAELELHINSNGGEAFEAVAIYNLLCQYKGRKTAYVDGVAHSAAFVLLFACDHRIMGQGTAALFHNMWTYTQGNATQLRQAADRLDQLMQSNRKIYLERAQNITEEEMAELMEKETILTPEQCLHYGFCDEVRGYVVNAEAQEEAAMQQAGKLERLAAAQEAYRQQLLQFSRQALQKGRTAMEDTGPDPEEPPGRETEGQNGGEPRQQEAGQQEKNNHTAQKALNIMSAFLMAATKTGGNKSEE